ncbi:YkvA family protein [Methyloraptor flagellatus]|uniref:YkvA family protein n=1 Tax=Methyloraptor flagellatus TaxID=3162530 RepID=A0AAU7X8V3_9HYPH
MARRDDGIYLDPEIIGPEETRETRVRDGFWRTVRRAARAIPFMDDVVAGYLAALDPETPRRVRFTLLAALAYFVSPIDILPDVLPLIGFTDDATVLVTALGLVAGSIKPEHREIAKRLLDDPPKA